MSRKKKKISKIKIFYVVISVICLILIILNSFLIFKYDVLPAKYLTAFILIVDIFPLLLMFFLLKRNIIKPVKIFSLVLEILYIILLTFTFIYLNKTFSFIDSINDSLFQKEDYYIKVLDSSSIKAIGDLKNKKVGIYKNEVYDDIINRLEKKVSVNESSYDDPVKLFEDLQDKEIDAIVLNDTIDELLETELSYFNLTLRNIDTISIPLKNSNKNIVKIVDVTNTTFNIYIAGGDAYGSIDKVMNTDVNMVASINPKSHKILLTSIPRDYYVLLPNMGSNAYDKLTHAGYYGVEESVATVENLLDIDINYYAKINFSTIENIVDAIGGIDVYSDYAFNFSDPGRNLYFSYKKGLNHLNGKQALGFARERSSFKDGDVQRVKDQQKVLEAMINKVSSSKTLIANYMGLLDAISANFSTNLDTKSISRLVKLQLNDMPKWEIASQNLTGFDGSAKCYSIPSMNLYVMRQDENSVLKVQNKLKDFLENK